MNSPKSKKSSSPSEIAGSIGSAVGGIVGAAAGTIASGVAQIASQVMPKGGLAENVPSEVAVSASVTMPPTDEEIGRRAYEIYLSEGCPEGRSHEHWLQAERELSQASGS
ncbi:MAG: DUF2934 domain-containing protein [Chthoniobacterales bacterium]